MRTATGCRTSWAGTMIGATCYASWTIRALSRPRTVLSEVVLEASGGLELPSVAALAAASLPVAIVNPGRPETSPEQSPRPDVATDPDQEGSLSLHPTSSAAFPRCELKGHAAPWETGAGSILGGPPLVNGFSVPQIPHLRHSREGGNPSPARCTAIASEAVRHAARPNYTKSP